MENKEYEEFKRAICQDAIKVLKPNNDGLYDHSQVMVVCMKVIERGRAR